MADLLTTYARDIGEFEKLREKHKDLADYVVRYCLTTQSGQRADFLAGATSRP